MKVTNWDAKAILYIVGIDNNSKLGISNTWIEQEEQFKKDYSDVLIQLFMKTDFDHYWQAELVEQVIKLKFKDQIADELHQWFKSEVSLPKVLECCKQVRSVLEKQYSLHEHIHKKGNHRWDFYNRVFETLKPRLNC